MVKLKNVRWTDYSLQELLQKVYRPNYFLIFLEFSDLDHASEYVENSLLERATYVRAYWLLFNSFRKLHTQAVLKATYEIFEQILFLNNKV